MTMKMSDKNDRKRFAVGTGVMMFACVLAVGRAMAGAAGGDVPAVSVKFQDLNLSASAGVAVLYRRIHTAAQTVCNVADGERDPARLSRAKACTDESEARAVSKVNVAGLTAYYQAKTGRLHADLAVNRPN